MWARSDGVGGGPNARVLPCTSGRSLPGWWVAALDAAAPGWAVVGPSALASPEFKRHRP